MEGFYNSSRKIIEDIRNKSIELLSEVKEKRVKDILIQRTKTSSFIKGVLAYHLHGGLSGNFDDTRKIELSSYLEIFSSYGTILDNVIDRHNERNGRTTYLLEYGPTIQLFASQYALNYGLRKLFPMLGTFSRKYSEKFKFDQILMGMIKMDIGKSINLEDHLKTIGSVNGFFNETILVMASSIATKDEKKINSVGDYGFNLGIGLGIFEELRDLLGEHGRRKATEIEEGRLITPIHIAKGFDYSPYVGKKLSEEEYKKLLYELQNRGALEVTRDLVKEFFAKSLDNLESTVTTECVREIKPLHVSIEDSMDRMLTKKYL